MAIFGYANQEYAKEWAGIFFLFLNLALFDLSWKIWYALSVKG